MCLNAMGKHSFWIVAVVKRRKREREKAPILDNHPVKLSNMMIMTDEKTEQFTVRTLLTRKPFFSFP